MQNIFLLIFAWMHIATGLPSSAYDYEKEIGRQIALSFIELDGFKPTREQLETAENIGIQLVELSDPSQIEHLPIDHFHILLGSELRYLTMYEISSRKTELIGLTAQHYRNLAVLYPDRIAAVSLFYFPADYSDLYYQAIHPVADSLASEIGKPLYYQSAQSRITQLPGSLSFTSYRMKVSDIKSPPFPVVYFEPDDDTIESLNTLEQVLNQSLKLPESVIILPADWFFERISHQPDLAVLFSSYLEGNKVLFPLPEEDNTFPTIHFGVLLMLLIWASFIVHYRYQPLFRGFVIRYFFNHSFFVADILEQRIRNLSSGAIFLIQHCLIVGLFFYTVSNMLISDAGFSALQHHFPSFLIAGYETESLFVIGIILAFVSHLVSVFWIYLLNKELKHISQAVNLYGWFLTPNLLIVTALVYMEQLQISTVWTLIAVALFLLIWFFSFNVAAIDAAKYLHKYRALNIFVTVGLHVLFLLSAFVFLLFLPGFYEIFELALWLP